jgi:hypothetical protein
MRDPVRVLLAATILFFVCLVMAAIGIGGGVCP